MNMNGLSNDVTEVIARAILYKNKQMDGIASPTTDEWADVYGGMRRQPLSQQPMAQQIEYNIFRAEVDSIVGTIMRSVHERGYENGY